MSLYHDTWFLIPCQAVSVYCRTQSAAQGKTRASGVHADTPGRMRAPRLILTCLTKCVPPGAHTAMPDKMRAPRLMHSKGAVAKQRFCTTYGILRMKNHMLYVLCVMQQPLSKSLLHHTAHAAGSGRHRRCFFLDIRHNALGGEQCACHAGCVLQRASGNLYRIKDS